MSEWPSSTLDQLAERGQCEIKTGPFGTVLKAAEYTVDGVPLVSTGEVLHGGFRITEKTPRVGAGVTSRLPQFLLQEGDVVFARKGGVERNAYVSADQDGWFLGSDALRVRPGSELLGRFLAYHVASPAVKQWLLQQAGGSTMASLNQRILGRISVPIPPLPEQERIAAVLGAFDDAIETNRRLMTNILDLTRAIYGDAASRADDEVPLGDLVAVNPDKRRPGLAHEPLNYLDIGALSDAQIGDANPLTWENAPSRARQLASVGDTLWATVRPNRRAHGLLAREIPDLVVSTGIAVLRPLGVPMSLVFAHTDAQSFVDRLVLRGDGSAYPAVRAKDFLMIPIPRLDAEDVSIFRTVLDPMWQVVGELEAEIADLARQRDELLPLLMSGRVKVEPEGNLVS